MKRIFILLLMITGLYIIFHTAVRFDLWNAKEGNGQAPISNDTQIIQVNVGSAQTEIIPEDRSNLRAVYNGDQKLKVHDSGDSVEVSLKGSWFDWFNWGSSKRKLIIYIPKDYARDMDIQLGSGSLQFSGAKQAPMKLDHLMADIGSGKMALSNIEVSQLKQDVFDVSSGKLDIKHYQGAVTADVSSGLFNLQLDQLMDSVTMDVSSGSVHLDLPKKAGFTLQGDVSSGNISCDFPLTEKESSDKHLSGKYGSGTHKITLDVSSGNIDIY